MAELQRDRKRKRGVSNDVNVLLAEMADDPGVQMALAAAEEERRFLDGEDSQEEEEEEETTPTKRQKVSRPFKIYNGDPICLVSVMAVREEGDGTRMYMFAAPATVLVMEALKRYANIMRSPCSSKSYEKTRDQFETDFGFYRWWNDFMDDGDDDDNEEHPVKKDENGNKVCEGKLARLDEVLQDGVGLSGGTNIATDHKVVAAFTIVRDVENVSYGNN